MGLSLSDLDTSTESELGYEFEVVLEGQLKESGIFLTVQGDNSEKLKQAERRASNLARQREALNTKKNKDYVRTIEEDQRFILESVARRVIAWRGLEDECTQENVIRLLDFRPELIEQVINNSKNLANFIKSK